MRRLGKVLEGLKSRVGDEDDLATKVSTEWKMGLFSDHLGDTGIFQLLSPPEMSPFSPPSE